MIKREAQFSQRFANWLRSSPQMSGPYELKQTTKDSLPFSCVAEHQLNALLACNSDKGFWYKISDQSQGIKPFDGIYYRNSPAWIVIKYPRFFVIIGIQTFIFEKKRSKRKSLTAERAKEISVKTVIFWDH